MGLILAFVLVAPSVGIIGVYFYASIGGIPLLIFGAVVTNQKIKLRIFNSYRV